MVWLALAVRGSGDPGPAQLSPADQTVTVLEYFPRWETPDDADAHQTVSALARDCPDFLAMQKAAPAGSEKRRLVVRFFDSFEEAGQLIRAGRMNEAIFFDSWYGLPETWNKYRVFVQGLRTESGNPQLYEAFEWLAGRAEQFWADRAQHPPHWIPLDNPAPTAADRRVFATFDRVSPRWPESWQLLEELRKNHPSYEEFRRRVPAGTRDYIVFDAILCYYDRAGTLVKNGIIDPRLLFTTWRSPSEVWLIVAPYVKKMRAELHSPHLYDNIDWLVDFERAWRRRPENAQVGFGHT